jgi:hypothetical protein
MVLKLQHPGTCTLQSAPHSGCPSHISPDSTMPFPHAGVGIDVDVDDEPVVVDVVELVVEVVVAQPPLPQASQQVGRSPTHPPCARQSAGCRTRHRVVPLLDVRQHVA